MKMGMTRGVVWAVASLVLMLVGAFGPWAKVLIVTINGTDDGRDGWLVVGAVVVAAAALLLYLWRPRRWVAAISLLAGCAGGATAVYDISDIRSFSSGTTTPRRHGRSATGAGRLSEIAMGLLGRRAWKLAGAGRRRRAGDDCGRGGGP